MRKIILCLLAMPLILFACGDTNHEVSTGPGTSNPTGAVQGFVRDYKTNAAIEDVTVTLYAAGTRTTTTDAVGYWYFDNVRAETTGAPLAYSLTATDADEDGTADYLPMMGTTTILETVSAGSTDYGQTNALTTVADWMVQTATVSGFVTDSTSGKGINGATVVLLDFLTTTPGLGAGQWGPGFSNARVDCATLTATTAARTEGGDGYYSFTTVPALTIAVGNLGAYATGYEYATPAIDNSAINLQFGSSAIVDFQLNPLDNNLGLVVASVTTATGTTTNMLIMVDATGAAATGAVPKVNMNGATQLVFNLIFDQPIETTSFYGDTIQLHGFSGLALRNLAPVWTTGNYALTLTGQIDIFDDAIGNPYTLVATRNIRPSTGAAVEQIAAWADGDADGIYDGGEGGALAQFDAYNSTLVATNPTPALFMEDADTALVGNVNVNLYSADSEVNPTTAQNYTGMWEENVLNPYGFTAQTLAAEVDIYWTDAAPVYDVSAISVYVRERDPDSSEVLNNWAEITIVPGDIFQADDRFIVMDLDVAPAQFAFTGAIAGQLRFGNVLDIAVVLDDTLGIENAIDTTKLLTLADVRAPEIAGFWDFATTATTDAPDYEDGMIVFSETMSPTASTSVATNNSALFSMTPAWVVDATDVETRLLLNAVGTTASGTVSTAGTGAAATIAAGVITFDSADEANLFFFGQMVKVTYDNGDIDVADVTVINTATPTITLNPALLTGDFTDPATLSVSGTTGFRSGSTDTFAGGGAGDTALTCATNDMLDTVAVGDVLILRKSTDINEDISVTVTEVSYAGTGNPVTVTFASTDTTGYDTVIFKGDVLTVTATDEAGNAMHGDANEVTPDLNDAWPDVAVGAPAIR